MSFDLTLFQKSLKSAFKQIETDQSDALSIEIAANFIAGQTAAEKHKSIKSADPTSQEDDGLTEEETLAIASLTARYAGYISEFNDHAQAQVLSKVTAMAEAGNSQEKIKQYVDSILSGEESIVIDNTGKERKVIYVDENLKLSEVTKTIEKPFYSSVNSYASLIGANVAHIAYEAGRKSYNRSQGFDKWIFTGPADERARPYHVALLGQAYEFGSVQSNYAEKCLGEPRCRHRAEVFWNDPSKDKSPEYWGQLKKDAGLFWDRDAGQWALK